MKLSPSGVVLGLAAALLAVVTSALATSCSDTAYCFDCSGTGGGSTATGTSSSSASGTGGGSGGSAPACTVDKDCSGGNKCCAGSGCVDLQTSHEHCGSCNLGCGSPNNASATCVAAQCELTCATGWANCNLLLNDGCEADTTSDPINCSACGVACLFANADPACAAGVCTLMACHAGFADCNGKIADGCETDLANDPANCTACGNACMPPANVVATCTAGACATTGDCVIGFAECDGMPSTGCETNVLTDVNNCGACAMPCPALPHATATCTGGGCAIASCDPGFADCDHSVYSGCEIDLGSDVNNCATCGMKCPAITNGYPACSAGACVVGGCDAGYADCDGDPTNGCEVHLANDDLNCGACKVKCANVANGSPTCGGFVCGIGACNTGFADCFGGVVNGCETDLTSDVNHCGDCATVCPLVANGSRSCATGMCGIASCAAGFGNCDNLLGNGCETTFAADLNNCGSCGHVCPTPANGTASCASGMCTLASCNAGFSDCDNNPANGCERNTLNDPNNCGGCGIKCGSGTCVNSACTCSKSVLLIADDSASGTAVLGAALTTAGYTVTQTAVPSYQYTGANPALTGFGAVIVLAGGPQVTSYQTDMPAGGQTAIVNFANAGNGVVFTEWAAFEVANGHWQTLAPLVLLTRTNAYSGQVTYTIDPAFAAHPVWMGLPATFTFASTSNTGITKVAAGVTRIAGSAQAIDAVAIRDAAVGRVVHLAHAGNYAPNGWTNLNIQKLVANATGWVARCY